MASDMYSLWLMPDASSLQELAAINRDLAARFGAPCFDPHLTLVGGKMLGLEAMKAALPGITRGLAAFHAPILDIATSDLYFRSFYALFGATGSILDLKRRAMRAILDEDTGDFTPHVSLLYGAVAPEAKAITQNGMRKQLAGRDIRFGAVAIALSSDTLPVKDWKIVAQVDLV